MKCPDCNTQNQNSAKFCYKCGAALPAENSDGLPKKIYIIGACILAALLLISLAVFLLVKANSDKNSFSQEHISDTDEEIFEDEEREKEEERAYEDNTAEETYEKEPSAPEELPAEDYFVNKTAPSELREELSSVSEQFDTARNKLNREEYGEAASDLEDVLITYWELSCQYGAETEEQNLQSLIDEAFALYTRAVLKQAEVWENQPVSAPLYQQINSALVDSVSFTQTMLDNGMNINAEDIIKNYTEFSDRYKEKYILAFNDLRTGDNWSRTTAWKYMQDAASVGLVDKNNPDDPLTLRYTYALAMITQKEITEGLQDGSINYSDAVNTLYDIAESTDFNPVTMRDLAIYFETVENDIGDCNIRSDLIKDACRDVYDYLITYEGITIQAEDLFVSSGSRNNAIALDDFWYFNDFENYPPSSANGVSPAGRDYIRTVFKETLDKVFE